MSETLPGHLSENTTYVRSSQKTIIPPLSEVIVTGYTNNHLPRGKWGLVETNSNWRLGSDVCVAREVVDLDMKEFPVRMMNVSTFPKVIHKGISLARITELKAVFPKDKNPDDNVKSPDVPEFLQDLVKRSGEGMSMEESEEVKKLICDYADIFAKTNFDLGEAKGISHYIDVGDSSPIKQRFRRLPMATQAEVEKLVMEMDKVGIVEPSSSPYCSNIVVVRKPDNSIRLCLDYRLLNEVTKADSYPLPRIDDTIRSLVGVKYLSTMDLASGYWQVKVHEDSKEKTAFVVGGRGLFQFRKMPMGLKNSGATFQRLMERVFQGLIGEIALVYLDDVVVFATNFEDMFGNLRVVFDRLREAGLKLKPKKCDFFKKSLLFLGHQISVEGISCPSEKIEVINHWPTPRSVTEVRSFLGLASYYRSFCKDFATVAKPLHILTEKGRKFIWNDDCQKSFDQLKEILSTSPVLAYPDPNLPFILDTDASNTGIGGVISQIKEDGKEHIVACASRCLSKPEKNYCVTRRELLAAVAFVKHFKYYLADKKFTLRTDHASLRWLMSFKEPEGQVARWISVLSTYQFDIVHRPGKKHGNADALSRMPCPVSCAQCNRIENACSIGQSTTERQKLRRLTIDPWEKVQYGRSEFQVNSEWLPENMTQSQRDDPEFGWIFGHLEDEKRPEWSDVSPQGLKAKFFWSRWDQLKLIDGVLHIVKKRQGYPESTLLLLPSRFRREVLESLHSSQTAAHFGVKKTLFLVHERFFWHDIRDDVKQHCQQCSDCASRKSPTKKPRTHMKKYLVGLPMERVALDILGPLPETYNGNLYILVTSDYFTKWVEAYALPDLEAETIAQKLVSEFISRYGAPRIIHTDQGSNFQAKLMSELCTLLQIKKTRCSAYHPASNGMVERYNKSLVMSLAIKVEENQRDWDECLPFITMAYRATVHDVTGFSPNQMMFGREITLPLDLMTGGPPCNVQLPCSSYVLEVKRKMESSFDEARRQTERRTLRNKRCYDIKSGQKLKYDIGDSVWVFCPAVKKGRTKKLACRWQGPCTITEIFNDVIYKLQTPQGKTKVVHFDRLKIYVGAIDEKSVQDVNDDSDVEEPPVDDDHLAQEEIPSFTRSGRFTKPPRRLGEWTI